MKKRTKVFLTFIILLSFAITANSQTSLGFFAGLNSAKLKGDSPKYTSYKGQMGLNAGVYLDVQVGKIIYLSFQPSYSQEGTKVFYDVAGSDELVDSLRIKLNYFSLPIMVKVTSTNKRFYAIAGIETSYLLDSFIKNGDEKEDMTADIAEINIALAFGAGLRIPLKYGRLFIELRYSQGLVNLTDEVVFTSEIPRVKTSDLRILFGYEIPLSKNKNN
jgi:hypothetical protein